ncbi:MAG: hypothetical protein ACOXZR_02385 [Bacilli bacterium]|jgi:hypothetical protein
MKISFFDNEKFVLYLNKYYIKDLKLDDEKEMEIYFKKLFLRLKNNYKLKLGGYYNIKIYSNKRYGLVIEVEKLISEYFKVYGNNVEMRIAIILDNLFLYEIEDYFFIKEIKKYLKNVYYKDLKYYLEIDEEIDEKTYSFLLENSKVVYGETLDNLSCFNQIEVL